MQDVGARFYTYIYTMAYAMEACAQYNKKFVVFDRPNPLGGIVAEGNILDLSLIHIFPIILALQFPSFFLPVYTLIGISLPLYLLYLLSRNFYWHLSRNLDDLKNMDKYDLKGEDNENRN